MTVIDERVWPPGHVKMSVVWDQGITAQEQNPLCHDPNLPGIADPL